MTAVSWSSDARGRRAEPVHQLLGPVRDERRTAVGDERVERVAHRRLGEQVGRRRRRRRVGDRDRRAPRSSLRPAAPAQPASTAYALAAS